ASTLILLSGTGPTIRCDSGSPCIPPEFLARLHASPTRLSVPSPYWRGGNTWQEKGQGRGTGSALPSPPQYLPSQGEPAPRRPGCGRTSSGSETLRGSAYRRHRRAWYESRAACGRRGSGFPKPNPGAVGAEVTSQRGKEAVEMSAGDDKKR